MKVLSLTVLILSVVLADRCKPKYHFWRPYNGSIPNDAFLAGEDANGTKNYVAKIIPLDRYLWTVPAQLKQGYNHIDFAWHESKDIIRVDQFIEILCTKTPDKLTWERVIEHIDEVPLSCCFVQGGIALYGNAVFNSYIGKGLQNGINYIGRIYFEQGWNGVHVMDGRNSTKIYNNFDVLSYDC